jgi:hypothetical protein
MGTVEAGTGASFLTLEAPGNYKGSSGDLMHVDKNKPWSRV